MPDRIMATAPPPPPPTPRPPARGPAPAAPLHPRPYHAARRPPRLLYAGEDGPRREHLPRDRVEPEGQLREDAQSALRADEEARQVVAGGGLHRHPARAHHRPVGQHDLEAEDPAAHNAVAPRAAPAGVRAGHPAEGGVLPRLKGTAEPALRQ